ncbi:MAG: hypothetical protein QM756_44225 [Polyangiaceae bacterium]
MVDGERIRDSSAIREGCTLRFGSEGNEWQLCDASPPAARAVSSQGQVVSMGAAGLLLPDAETCEAYVSNQDGAWLVERDGEILRVSDGETLVLSGDRWQLELTLGDHSLQAPTTVLHEDALTRLRFKASPDEEHVELVVEIGDQRHVISHRSHLYLLLLLARARLDDQRGEQAPASEQGWIETKELAKMLQTTTEQVNVWIWRARQQLKSIDPELAQRVVERRPTLGQLRIGYDALSVERTSVNPP